MTTLTLHLPEPLTQALYQHRVSQEQLQAVVINAIEDWLRYLQSSALPKETPPVSPFAESAIPFVEQLLDHNQSLSLSVWLNSNVLSSSRCRFITTGL